MDQIEISPLCHLRAVFEQMLVTVLCMFKLSSGLKERFIRLTTSLLSLSQFFVLLQYDVSNYVSSLLGYM